MKCALVLSVLCFVFVSNALSERELFTKFVSDYGRKYESEEEHAKRFAIFQDNLVRMKKLNANSKHATFAVNEFADITPEEFHSQKLMKKMSGPALAQSCLAKGVGNTKKYSPEEIAALPDSWDWRTTGGKDNKGVVTRVKNQAQCGSCWTFSSTWINGFF